VRLRDFKGPVGILAVSMFLDFTGHTIIIPVIPFLIGRYVPATSVALVVGLIISAYAFCQFLAAPLLGALSDRFGRRPVLLASLLGSVAGYVIFGLGGALWVLFVGRIIDGLTGGNISTLFAYVADVTEPKKRGQVYGLLGAAGGFGFIVGPVLGGLTGHFSLAAPVFIAALLTLGNAAWAYRALPESLPPERRTVEFGRTQLNPFAPFADVLGNSLLRSIFGSAFLFYLAGTMLQSNFSVFLKDRLGFGPGGIGTLLLIVGIMDIASQGYLTGKLLPGLGESLLAKIGLAINAVGFLMIAAIAYVPSLILLYAAIVVFVLGDGLFQPSINSLIANTAPSDSQGRVQGANQAQQAVARTLGPLLGAMLYMLGAAMPYAGGAFLIVIALTVLVLQTKKTHRNRPKAQVVGEVPNVVQN
jgi:DHA1 family tetracycline resistance protein-like MFS transporter